MDKILKILNGIKPNVDFKVEKQLIKDGILTSLEMVQLTLTLSDEFDIEITPLDILPENFQSAETIKKLVDRLLEE